MDAISNYQKAVAAIKNAVGDGERIAKIVKGGAKALDNWPTMVVANADAGFPPEIAMSPSSPRIDAREWPTGQQIATAISRYHDAKQALRVAFAAIPDAQRDVVQAPENYFASE